MYPDQDTGAAARANAGPRRRTTSRHFKPSHRKPRTTPPAERAVEKASNAREARDDEPQVLREESETEFARPAPRPALQEEEPSPEPQERRVGGSPISKALDHVQHIIDELRGALDEMELVQELLEEAERQQIDDDREIKSLQRALDRLHRSKDGFRSQSAQREADRR